MPNNKLEDLRNHLFAQLERLDDENLDLDQEIKRANAIAAVASNIVNSARVEIQYLKITGRGQSEFMQSKNVTPVQIQNGQPKQITNFSHADKCVETAVSHGHTKEDAENCENYSIGCPDCLYK